MTNDEIKKMLYNYPKLYGWIKDYEQDLEHIREQLDKHYGVGCSVISDMPRGTDISDKTFNAVERIDKLKEVYIDRADYIAIKLESFYNQKKVVENILPKLTPTQQFLIEKRYFEALNWDDVVAKDSQCRVKKTLLDEHRKMLEKLEKDI